MIYKSFLILFALLVTNVRAMDDAEKPCGSACKCPYAHTYCSEIPQPSNGRCKRFESSKKTHLVEIKEKSLEATPTALSNEHGAAVNLLSVYEKDSVPMPEFLKTSADVESVSSRVNLETISSSVGVATSLAIENDKGEPMPEQHNSSATAKELSASLEEIKEPTEQDWRSPFSEGSSENFNTAELETEVLEKNPVDRDVVFSPKTEESEADKSFLLKPLKQKETRDLEKIYQSTDDEESKDSEEEEENDEEDEDESYLLSKLQKDTGKGGKKSYVKKRGVLRA